MRTDLKTTLPLLLVSLLFAAALPNTCLAADTPPKAERPKLYDMQADGKEQVAAALKTAKDENKRLILKFGANW